MDNLIEPAVELRDYQIEAAAALYADLARGIAGVVDLPTGSGKSLVLAAVADNLVSRGLRVLVIAPQAELIEQDVRAFRRINETANVSICCAQLGKRQTDGDIVFATPGSVVTVDVGVIDVVLVDEAHRVGTDENSQILTILRRLEQRKPSLRVGGLTATPYRGGGRRLEDGPIFQRVTHSASYVELVRRGFLAPIVGPKQAIGTHFDLNGVRVQNGDFVPSDLSSRVDTDDLNASVAREIIHYARGRRAALIFCVSIDHAMRIAAAIRALGEDCLTVSGLTSIGDREKIFANLRNGDLRFLSGVDVFSTGFDVPAVDLIALCRPTQSPIFHVQGIGRGTRIAPGKKNCLVLDFAGNFARCGPFDAPVMPSMREGRGRSLVKQCIQCDAVIGIAARTCPHCDAVLITDEDREDRSSGLDARPDFSAVMLSAGDNADRVIYMRAAPHKKAGAADSLRLKYTLENGETHTEWLALWAYNDFGRKRARQLWISRWPNTAIPANAQAAADNINGNLRRYQPQIIRVDRKVGSHFVAISFVKGPAAP